MANKFCTVAPNICESVRNLLLAPRILSSLPDFWGEENCAPLIRPTFNKKQWINCTINSTVQVQIDKRLPLHYAFILHTPKKFPPLLSRTGCRGMCSAGTGYGHMAGSGEQCVMKFWAPQCAKKFITR